MIIGVDIGGTKTYVACFAENGTLLKEARFETSRNYSDFVEDLKIHAQKLETRKAKIACVAVPGLIDRKKGIVRNLGNLPWKDEHIQNDLANALGIKNTYIENDSKLAGLAEARYISEQHQRVFYLTISTGIGGALIVNGKLDKNLMDMEIGKIPLEHSGKILDWEDFSSGRAFFEKYKKKAVDTHEDSIWEEFAKSINLGIGIICSSFQVDVIVFGGGLGQYLSRFKKYIESYLLENLHPIVKRPEALLSTHYRSQSVVYGCYEYAKDHLT